MNDIFFIVQSKVLLLDLAGPAEAFRIAGKLGPEKFRLHFIGVEEDIDTSIGISMTDIASLPEKLPDGSLLFILGTTNHDCDPSEPVTHALLTWLRKSFDPDRQRLACVCAGAILAAMAGLLDNRRCTTHHSLTARLSRLAPGARIETNRIFVVDGPVMTSAGITAGMDLALHIVAQIAGERVAMDVAREMVVYLRRSGDETQQSPWLAHRSHLHPVVHRIQDMIPHDPARDWPLAELAATAAMSSRNLTRQFRRETGISIVVYHQSLRIALAKQELAAGGTVESAAAAAGFESARSLRRLWPRFEHGTPGEKREIRKRILP